MVRELGKAADTILCAWQDTVSELQKQVDTISKEAAAHKGQIAAVTETLERTQKRLQQTQSLLVVVQDQKSQLQVKSALPCTPLPLT